MATAPETDTPSQRARVVWQQAFSSELQMPPLALGDGLLIAVERGDTALLRRLDAADGATVWERDLGRRTVGPAARTGDLVAIPLTGGHFATLSVHDGSPLGPAWAPLPSPAHPDLIAASGRVFVRSGHGDGATLTCYLEGRAIPAWVVPDPAGGTLHAQMRFTRGVLVVASPFDGAGVVALGVDGATGRTRWAYESDATALHDVWAVAGIVDLVTSSGVVGLDAFTGEQRSTRFSGFPLDSARAVGDHLIAMMEGHMGPVLLCFHTVTQRLVGRISRAMTRLVGAHPSEALITLINGDPVFYALPDLTPLELPEADAINPPGLTAWSRDMVYVVSEDRRVLTAVDLDVPEG